jgi:glutathione S-transferase
MRRTRARLGGRDYLEDRFSAGDLLMTTVLRFLRHTDIASPPSISANSDAARRRRPRMNAASSSTKPRGTY